ncbi:hypothetical protein ACJMK2_032552 [Sinanodonta woodiana]|uniref:Transposase n=1 Tax=Sinanodonta woodiana TaxID=1069815 RepID=A0ABD3X239_SINWO
MSFINSRLCNFYFHLRLSYSEILSFSAKVHGLCISMRTLKRILRTLYLFRRRFNSDVLEVAQFIEENVSNSGNQQGYRWMHLHCLQHGLILLDSAGIQLRQRRRLRRRQYLGQGTDYIWHADSYDKLK